MNSAIKVLVVVNRLFFLVSVFFLSASTILATMNAITRKFFPGLGGFTWAEELSAYCCVLMLFTGAAYLELTNKHLCIGILENLIKNPKKRVIVDQVTRIFRGIVTIGLLSLVVRYGIVVMQNMMDGHMITWAMRVPKLWFFLPMLIGIAMIVIVWIAILIFKQGKELDNDGIE